MHAPGVLPNNCSIFGRLEGEGELVKKYQNIQPRYLQKDSIFNESPLGRVSRANFDHMVDNFYNFFLEHKFEMLMEESYEKVVLSFLFSFLS